MKINKILHLHTPFNQTQVLTIKLFLPVKWYVKDFSINIYSHYYVLKNNESNKSILSLRTIINGNVKLICYD